MGHVINRLLKSVIDTRTHVRHLSWSLWIMKTRMSITVLKISSKKVELTLGTLCVCMYHYFRIFPLMSEKRRKKNNNNSNDYQIFTARCIYVGHVFRIFVVVLVAWTVVGCTDARVLWKYCLRETSFVVEWHIVFEIFIVRTRSSRLDLASEHDAHMDGFYMGIMLW